MPPAPSTSLARERSKVDAAATSRESSGRALQDQLPTRVASTKEEKNSSSSSEDDSEDNGNAAVRQLSPAGVGKIIEPSPKNSTGELEEESAASKKNPKGLLVETLVAPTETHVQEGNPKEPSIATKEPKFLTVTKGLLVTKALSPRSRAMTTSIATVSTKSTVGALTAFGKFRRASTSAKGELARNQSSAPAVPSTLELQQQQRSTQQAAPESKPGAFKPQKTEPILKIVMQEPTANGFTDGANGRNLSEAESSGHDFVDEVRKTLEQLVTQLDSVDPKKLLAIRLGGELRGLLGKALDEFCAYESAFLEHASQVGVSIALQNFSASLVQVFEIVARLQTAKAFLLNKKFKREVLFAFQEINSYYTSLFMELSMAIARRSGVVLPLPSPVKPQPPVVVEEEPTEEEVKPVVMVEQAPPEPPKEPAIALTDMTCLEAHQYFYGHRREKDLAKALGLYKNAAELGSVEAKTSLGDMFYQGLGVEKDLLVAETWLCEAASTGSTDACHLLGCLLCEQAQHQPNALKQHEMYSLAMIRFTHAAENGHSGAQYELGIGLTLVCVSFCPDVILTRGWPEANSVRSFQSQALSTSEALLQPQGHTAAEASLGRILYLGFGDSYQQQNRNMEREIIQAIHFLQRAAAKNDSSSQMYLGRIFAQGDGVKADLERAIAYYRKAVEGGNCRAMLELAQLLLTPDTPHDRSPPSVRFSDREETHDEALRLLLNAGAGGVVDAYFTVGELLEYSKSFKDKSVALRFYSKAANQSHAKAAKRVAAMHYSGISTLTDKWKAHKFYAIAANAGDPEAFNALGLMCEEGEGCDLDFKKAGECYRKAVELNNPHAHFNLGCLLSQGKGVTKNLDAAQSHFQKALELGYSLARDFLKPTDWLIAEAWKPQHIETL